MRLITAVVMGVMLLGSAVHAAELKPGESIPVQDLFRSIHANRMALSPDGKLLASIYPRESGPVGRGIVGPRSACCASTITSP